MTSSHTCADCGATWTDERRGGRKPQRCGDCARKRNAQRTNEAYHALTTDQRRERRTKYKPA